jgi:hypothetical protein
LSAPVALPGADKVDFVLWVKPAVLVLNRVPIHIGSERRLPSKLSAR